MMTHLRREACSTGSSRAWPDGGVAGLGGVSGLWAWFGWWAWLPGYSPLPDATRRPGLSLPKQIQHPRPHSRDSHSFIIFGGHGQAENSPTPREGINACGLGWEWKGKTLPPSPGSLAGVVDLDLKIDVVEHAAHPGLQPIQLGRFALQGPLILLVGALQL